MPTTRPMTSQTVRLFGWDSNWRTAATPVLGKLFGQLVLRAIPVVQHFHMDLFRDAEWLRANVNGPTEFLWMARFSGTEMAEWASRYERNAFNEPRELYHVALTENDKEWSATFTLLVQHIEDAPRSAD